MDFDFTIPEIRFYEDGLLNASYNCLDVHINNGRGEDIALIWEGNGIYLFWISGNLKTLIIKDPKDDKKYTYS